MNRPSITRQKSAVEQRELTEAMASIKLHSKYQDPLKEWEKLSKQASFVSQNFLVVYGYLPKLQNAAQARLKKMQTQMVNLYVTASQITQATVEVTFQQQQARAERLLQERERNQEAEKRRNMERWEARNRSIWEQVDKAAAIVEARLEAERKAAEAEAKKVEDERKRKEQLEREKREKLESEKRRVAEEKEKAAQQERKKKEQEEKERLEAEEKQRKEKEQLSKFDTERKKAGITTPREDWDVAMAIIKVGLPSR